MDESLRTGTGKSADSPLAMRTGNNHHSQHESKAIRNEVLVRSGTCL